MAGIDFSALPSWLLFIIIVGGAVTLAYGALLLMQRFLKAPLRNNEVAGILFAVVGSVYATLLGFLVVSIWQELNAADLATSEEAAALVTVIRYSAMLPEPARAEVHDLLRQYTEVVSQEEWSAMSRGHGQKVQSGRALADINKIWNIYQQQPANAVNSEAMRSLSEMGRERILRLQSSTGGLPSIFWVLLALGGIIVVGFSLIFYMENIKLQIFLVCLMTFLIALCLWFIVVVNNPYDGDLQVSSEAFKYPLQLLDSLPR